MGADGVNNLARSASSWACAETADHRVLLRPARDDRKDTVRNAHHTGDFVVNMVDDPLAEQMNLSSGEYPPEVDEFAVTGLTAVPGVKVRAPRVAEAPISLECRSPR